MIESLPVNEQLNLLREAAAAASGPRLAWRDKGRAVSTTRGNWCLHVFPKFSSTLPCRADSCSGGHCPALSRLNEKHGAAPPSRPTRLLAADIRLVTCRGPSAHERQRPRSQPCRSRPLPFLSCRASVLADLCHGHFCYLLGCQIVLHVQLLGNESHSNYASASSFFLFYLHPHFPVFLSFQLYWRCFVRAFNCLINT